MQTAQPIDRPWRDYPLGTQALAINGGHWTKTERGWQWCTGATFPTPGGDAWRVRLPDPAQSGEASLGAGGRVDDDDPADISG